MRTMTMAWIACPAPEAGPRRQCQGGLVLDDRGSLPPWTEPDGEIVEGLLTCGRCGASYPIISGVAILIPAWEDYLAERFAVVFSLVCTHGAASPALTAWAERQRFDLHRRSRDLPALDSTIALHYERLADLTAGLDLPPGLRAFLAEADELAPYDLLARWAERHRSGTHLALDLGCGLGGVSFRLAPFYAAVLGLDLDFRAVLLARRILVGRPAPLARYQLWSEGVARAERPVPATNRPNLDLVVADAHQVPIPSAAADTAVLANLIDVTALQPPVAEALRTLRPGGLLLLTDPLQFAADRPVEAGCSPATLLTAWVRAHGLEVLESADWVPWVWYVDRRKYQVYLNWCVAVRR